MATPKTLDSKGKALVNQYERWQPRARYRLQPDPYVDHVIDCTDAGLILNAIIEHQDWGSSTSSGSSGSTLKDCVLLCACEAHESLPQTAEFPADVFTSCLTTPTNIVSRWFCSRSLLGVSINHSLIDRILGRQTLMGDLNLIFTAVTDTIAWNVLPHDLFQRLFRQDLLVASLFLKFLLVERIMRSEKCLQLSYTMLPSTHQRHMWNVWDMLAEICLTRLPSLLDDPNAEFQPSPFFTAQLTAFEVLDHGSDHEKPQEQLPIVLLSQCLRFRAIVLLGRLLDLGPWAVDPALSVGIFPYVLKLLQPSTMEMRQFLVIIWTKILTLDKQSCQVDSMDAYPEEHAMAASVLAVGHRQGPEACISTDLIHVSIKHLQLANLHDAQIEPLLLKIPIEVLLPPKLVFPKLGTLSKFSGFPSKYVKPDEVGRSVILVSKDPWSDMAEFISLDHPELNSVSPRNNMWNNSWVVAYNPTNGWVVFQRMHINTLFYMNVITWDNLEVDPLPPNVQGEELEPFSHWNGYFTDSPTSPNNNLALLSFTEVDLIALVKIGGGDWVERRVPLGDRQVFSGPVIHENLLLWITNGHQLEIFSLEGLHHIINIPFYEPDFVGLDPVSLCLGLLDGEVSLFIFRDILDRIHLPTVIRFDLHNILDNGGEYDDLFDGEDCQLYFVDGMAGMANIINEEAGHHTDRRVCLAPSELHHVVRATISVHVDVTWEYMFPHAGCICQCFWLNV